MLTCQCIGQLGRLGNQMFQIASTIGLSRKNNCSYFFPKWEYQEYFSRELPYRELTSSDDVATLHEGPADYRNTSIPNDKIYDLFGYFQAYAYFHPIKEEILSIFEVKPEIINYIEN